MRAVSSSMRFALAALVAGGISHDLQSRDLTARLQPDVQRMAESLARTQDPQDLGEQIAALIATAPDGALVVDWQGEGARLGNALVGSARSSWGRGTRVRRTCSCGPTPTRRPTAISSLPPRLPAAG